MIAILPKNPSKKIFSFDHYLKGKLVSLSWYILKSVVKIHGLSRKPLAEKTTKKCIERKQTN